MYVYMCIFWAKSLALFITFSLYLWTKLGEEPLLQQKYALLQVVITYSLDQEGYIVIYAIYLDQMLWVPRLLTT